MPGWCGWKQNWHLLPSPLLCPHEGGPLKFPISSCVFPSLCKRTMQPVRQLAAQVKIPQFCFMSFLYFIRFINECLINTDKQIIMPSKQAWSEIPETIKSLRKQFIVFDASVLGIAAILGITSLFTHIKLIECIFIVHFLQHPGKIKEACFTTEMVILHRKYGQIYIRLLVLFHYSTPELKLGVTSTTRCIFHPQGMSLN